MGAPVSTNWSILKIKSLMILKCVPEVCAIIVKTLQVITNAHHAAALAIKSTEWHVEVCHWGCDNCDDFQKQGTDKYQWMSINISL